jgi:hypothetical protein
MVIVEVGPASLKYEVHKALVTKHSEFFKKALAGPWKEADEHVVRLSNIEPSAFNIFMGWIYTGTIPGPTAQDWMVAGTCENVPHNVQPILGGDLLRLQACVVADQLVAPLFQQALNNAYVDLKVSKKKALIYESIIYAYANLPESCPILRLMVDSQCVYWRATHDTTSINSVQEIERRDELPHKFLVQVMVRMDYYRQLSDDKRKLNPCDYHIHITDDERKQCIKYKNT